MPYDDDLLRQTLAHQYKSGLSMLAEAVRSAKDELWISNSKGGAPYWCIAYHALFYTHLYIEPSEAAFKPWKHHREEVVKLGNPDVGEPYSKEEMLSYLELVEKRVLEALSEIDLSAADSGFSWKHRSTLEHKLENLRHLQHHTAQLMWMLREADGKSIPWDGGSIREE